MKKHAFHSVSASSRRVFLGASGALLTLLAHPGAAVTASLRTPRQTAGPFYPEALPLDHDNDLTRVSGRPGTARGVITHLSGRVSDDRGRPVPGARVEIWQCNAYGRYHHPRDRRDAPVDENFQGYGRFVTDSDGYYRFLTIRPVAYPGRTPHIHFAVTAPQAETLITQMYVAGEPGNARDAVLNRVRDARARESLVVTLSPLANAGGELAGRFDLVLAADGHSAGSVHRRRLEALRRSV